MRAKVAGLEVTFLKQFEALVTHTAALEEERLRLRTELDTIYRSATWRLSENTRRRLLNLFPPGSHRYNALMRLRQALLHRSQTGGIASHATASAGAPSLRGELWPHVPIDNKMRDAVARVFASLQPEVGRKRVVVVKSGGLGDNLQITPLLTALRRRWPEAVIVAAVERQAAVFEDLDIVDASLTLPGGDHQTRVKSALAAADSVYDVRYVSWVYGAGESTAPYAIQNRWLYDLWPNASTRLQVLREHVCNIMLLSYDLQDFASLADLRVAPKATAVTAGISRPFVVVVNAVDSSVGKLKQWARAAWNALVDHLCERGFAPVQLGGPNDELLSSKVIDLRGKTSVREAAYVLKQAAAYIGVEGGLFHLAKAVGTRSFVLFASTPPECFAYPDTIILTRSVCAPCWWAPGWDRGVCSRGVPTCLNLPTVESVTEALAANGY